MSDLRRLKIALISTVISSAVIAQDAPVWPEVEGRPMNWSGDLGSLKDIPQYVLDYAPFVHLNSKEYFWPSDMSEHLEHTTVYINQTEIGGNWTVDDLGDLNNLNAEHGRYVYLKSDDYIDMWKDGNIEDLPCWLTAEHNIPVSSDGDTAQVKSLSEEEDPQLSEDPYKELDTWWKVGAPTTVPAENLGPARFDRRIHKTAKTSRVGGKSTAPAVLIVVEKGNGVVDAFWFFFYSYNLGNSVFTFRFGNHVGDWEHSCIRFHNGVPKAIFLSEHEGGKSYTYRAMEKYGKRPVIYSASGTHAMYATPGIQDYVLPFRILRDSTDKGPLWDPLQNIYSYTYNTTLAAGHDRETRSLPSDGPADPLENSLTPSTFTPNAPTSWFYYRGHWGDKFLPRSDNRQYQLGTEKAYVSGPQGPRYKALGRRTVCPKDKCVLKDSVALRNWGLRLFIDYVYLIGGMWILVGAFMGARKMCRCCSGRPRENKRAISVKEGSILDIEHDGDMSEAREVDGLLAGDDLANVRENGLASRGNSILVDR